MGVPDTQPTSEQKTGSVANLKKEVSSEKSPIDPARLTPEEQMALYEEDLKEHDWGHQPC